MKWRGGARTSVGLLVLVGLNICLLAGVLNQLTFDVVTVGETPGNAMPLPELAKEIGARKPIEAYNQILAHPIFFKSREPFVPAPPAPPPPPPVPPPVVAVDPDLAVGGVMIKDGMAKAFLFLKNGSGARWANEGEEFQGWQVRSVTHAGVRLEQRGRAIELQLYPSN